MTVDGPVTAFTTFNNVNCPNGFLYFNKQVGKHFKYFFIGRGQDLTTPFSLSNSSFSLPVSVNIKMDIIA